MSIFIGYCITFKNVEAVRRDIANVLNFSFERSGIKDKVSYYKNFVEKTESLLETDFEITYGIEKCKRQLDIYKRSNNDAVLLEGRDYAVKLLGDLCLIVYSMIPLNNLPSCKSLLDFTKDVAMECLKDTTNDRFAKIGLGLASTQSKANDKVKIEDVLIFYDNIIKELDREKRQEDWTLSPIEQALYDKAKEECDYCRMAMSKMGIGFVHELQRMPN